MLNVQVGGRVTRLLGGSIPMELKVTSVTDTMIECGPWKFDRATGAEVDEDLGWGPGITGSYIKLEGEE